MNNREHRFREIALAGLAFLFLVDVCTIVLAQDGVRRLSNAESLFVAHAYDSLGNGPPSLLSAPDADSNTVTVMCRSIAVGLREQLRKGRVRVDSNQSEPARADHDGTKSTSGDQLTFSAEFMDSLMRGLIAPVHLIELGVHERAHKVETDRDPLVHPEDQLRNEVLALEFEKALKLAKNVPANEPHFKLCQEEINNCRDDVRDLKREFQSIFVRPAGGHSCFLLGDSGVADTFASFTPSVLGWYTHPLSSLHAGDMLVFQNHAPIPPAEARAVICGGIPNTMGARMRAYGILGDGTLREPPDYEQDYSPPGYPPLFFGSLAYSPERNMFFVLDTVEKRILNMPDANGDYWPDDLLGDYAHPLWPGFLPLQGATGLDAAVHRTLGFGLIVQRGNKHVPNSILFQQPWLFLPDADGDNMADACVEVPAYQFLNVLPAIVDDPIWPGQMSVMVSGTWQHNLLLWKSDSLGGNRTELLGMVQMSDLQVSCAMLRPLLAGEFVLPVDEEWGTHPSVATPVAYASPGGLTVSIEEGGLLHLRWEVVEGMALYRVYSSDDCESFFDMGLVTAETEVLIPPPPLGIPRQFYRVTAER